MSPFDTIMEFLTLDDSDIELDPAMELDLLAGGDPTTDPSNPEAQQGTAGAGATSTGAPQNVNTDNPQNTNAENNDAPDEGDPDEEDDMGDDMGGEDDEMGDEEDDGSTEDVDTNSGTSNDPDTDRRINLRKLIQALINAYATSINAMTKSTPPADEDLANKYYNLQEKMAMAKDILYDIATNDIYVKPYEDSLRRYSALNQLYSICIEYLNTILIKKAPKSQRKKTGSSAFTNQIKI